MYLDSYKKELGAITFPQDGAQEGPYPFYDRWGDSFNVTTEFTIPIQGRGLAVMSWLMAQSPLKSQRWRSATATIRGMPASVLPGKEVKLSLFAPGLDLGEATIVWESDEDSPAVGSTYRVTPRRSGPHWVEAEAQLPDGRRVYGVSEYRTP